MRALVLNGPNLNWLGRREPAVYGNTTYADLVELAAGWGSQLGIEVDCRQSNHEGQLIDWLQEACGSYEFVVFNPGGYSHTSVALRDAVAALSALPSPQGTPVFEVHISNIFARESFRHHSMISAVCRGTLCGFGIEGYRLALIAGQNAYSGPSTRPA
jgi:3-dehydroquinate dehydratase-2